MAFWDRLFGKKKKEETPSKKEPLNQYQLKWIEAKDNPWKIRLLDLRPISQTMLSTSKNAQMATNAMSYGQEDGLIFLKQKAKINKSMETNLSFPIDQKLEDGVLFIPSKMENKWAIYYHQDKILFVRSWLREVFVMAETQQANNKLMVHKIHGEFTEDESKELTESILKFLMHSHVLNEIVPAPIPAELTTMTDGAGLWAFSVYGNMAHYGYFESAVNYQTALKVRSHSLLHIAIARGDIYKIKAQLEQGANMNALAGDGLSPLQWAITAPLDIMEYLLQAGANPNMESDEGATSIMNAVQSNKMEHLQLLLKYQADVNWTDIRGFTALHRAAEMGRVDMVKELLEHGANKDMVAAEHTALSLAKARNNMEIVKLLK